MNSKMQIISGRYKGRKLVLPPDARPTQARARIALFNMLESVMDWQNGMCVWDAFAGSGEFGIEIISRFPGVRVVFSDISDSSIATVKKNLFGLDADATVTQADAMTLVAKIAPGSDLVFVDPPYADAEYGNKFIEKLSRVVRPGTVVIWEQDGVNAKLPSVENWEVLRDKRYGRARFLIMIKK